MLRRRTTWYPLHADVCHIVNEFHKDDAKKSLEFYLEEGTKLRLTRATERTVTVALLRAGEREDVVVLGAFEPGSTVCKGTRGSAELV